MKTISLMIDLTGIDLNEIEQKKTPQEISCIIARQILDAYAAKGIKEDQRRIFYKILDAMDEAVKNGATELKLEDAWFSFLQTARKETLLIPSRILRNFEKLMDEAK